MHRAVLADTPQSDSELYVVAYAKVIDCKDDGVYMQGVYFGGIGKTHAEAEQIARECINTTKRGTIMPRLIPASGQLNVLKAMQQAMDRFHRVEVQMIQAEEIMERTAARKARRTAAR